MDNATTRQRILNALEAAAGNFMYYDRKEDEDLPQVLLSRQ